MIEGGDEGEDDDWLKFILILDLILFILKMSELVNYFDEDIEVLNQIKI